MRASSLTTLLMVGLAACGKVAGFEEFTYSDGGPSDSAPAQGNSDDFYGGESGTTNGSGCGVDGAVMARGEDAAAGMACGFPVPNPVGVDLPNHYTPNIAEDSVTDNVTGLIWESTLNPTTVYSQDQAIRHCADKGGG